MANIFISYRRQDTAGYAGRLYDQLSSYFGADQVFMDIDTLEPGVDFVDVIEQEVSLCDILLVLIGRHWLTVTDKAGMRRLDSPHDFVRLEITTALNRNIPIIPVLLQGASMPNAEELPEALVKLTRRNAIEITDTRWHFDVQRLIKAIENILRVHSVKPLSTINEQLDDQHSSTNPKASSSDATPESVKLIFGISVIVSAIWVRMAYGGAIDWAEDNEWSRNLAWRLAVILGFINPLLPASLYLMRQRTSRIPLLGRLFILITILLVQIVMLMTVVILGVA